MQEIDVRTAKSWVDSGTAIIIDVREKDEFLAEHIEGSRLNPLTQFNPNEVRSNGKKILLICRSGRRSLEALAKLGSASSNAYSIQGGIRAWKEAGLDLAKKANVPISIMRQVQIVAGSMVFIGVLLGVTVSNWLLIIPAFFGAGLLFAGVTGTCGLAAVLSIMPWNRAFRSSCGN